MYNLTGTGLEYIRYENHYNIGIIHVLKVKDIDKANKLILLLKSKGILTTYAQYVKNIDQTYFLNQKSIDYIKQLRINKLKRIIG